MREIIDYIDFVHRKRSPRSPKRSSKSKSPEKERFYKNPMFDPLLRGSPIAPKKASARLKLIKTLGTYKSRR